MRENTQALERPKQVYEYRATVEKMNDRELLDELSNRPPRQRSATYLEALRREHYKRARTAPGAAPLT